MNVVHKFHGGDGIAVFLGNYGGVGMTCMPRCLGVNLATISV